MIWNRIVCQVRAGNTIAGRAIAFSAIAGRPIAGKAIAVLLSVTIAGCTMQEHGATRVSNAANESSGSLSAPTSGESVTTDNTSAHTLRIYVSAVNCEMNQADARRINGIAINAKRDGLWTEVVFAGIQSDTSRILTQAASDLGLEVPVRAIRSNELKAFESIGGAHLPMVLVTKARQLKTMIAGETMPRTLSVVEASMSPDGSS